MQLELAEIGGYFEFSLSNSAQFPYPNAFKYHSARSAFYDLIKKSKIKKIWIPRFICDSMLEPLKLLNVEVLFYPCFARKIKQRSIFILCKLFWDMRSYSKGIIKFISFAASDL